MKKTKKWWLCSLSWMLAAVLILSGCGKNESPKDNLTDSIGRSMSDLKSASFQTAMSMQMVFPESVTETKPELQMATELFKNAEIKVKGVYQMEPYQSEMTMELQLKGDMQLTLSIPMVMTAEKMWVKIPQTPLFPVPKELANKYLELDLKELGEQSGQSLTLNMADVKKQQEFFQEALKVMMDALDGKTYFHTVKEKDYPLPDGIKADKIVKFSVTEDHLEDLVKTAGTKVLPEWIDLLGSDKYKELFPITPEQLKDAKKKLEDMKQEDVKKELDKLKKDLTINKFELITAIDKNQFPTLQELLLDVEAKVEGEPVKFVFNIKTQTDKINEPASFEIGIPKETVTMKDLEKLGGGMQGY